ncbi:MAG: hypothetical protein KL787_07545 [Taibaiella sp.]|nr:hypothetical protein [Taibaiella sp.]
MVFGKRFISFLEFKSDKKKMKEALKWSEESLKLVCPEMDEWEKMMQLKAQAQYFAGKKEDARETAEDLVSTLSTHNKDTKQSQNIPDKIKSQQL